MLRISNGGPTKLLGVPNIALPNPLKSLQLNLSSVKRWRLVGGVGFMTNSAESAGATVRPDVRLTRRSLIAAGAVLSTIGPVAASRAFAQGNPNVGIPGCTPSNSQPNKCLCFVAGTHLLTPAGEVAIEDMRIGDLVATESGQARAIRWIGRITVDRHGDEPWNAQVMPIRVAKNAFGAGSPHSDLFLSPAHMVHLNGVLIPVGDLINGRTITAVNVSGVQLAYFHVVLATHDVIVAEGAPCESFLATAPSTHLDSRQ
jgi:hypothetical protein